MIPIDYAHVLSTSTPPKEVWLIHNHLLLDLMRLDSWTAWNGLGICGILPSMSTRTAMFTRVSTVSHELKILG
jgi:hypothetical protein